mmetsp:Transcript_21331/g.52207  ORF Transcript_21331/g.52207 Transcript_21331/m.52207 type:complete len:558 (-) Transcript_21331:217-1890(-)|eukprot:CAMPEP_0114513110 /NCGR_PEP_ID=MMETSP0109-20121206/15372_1 /TAXON_ID=29199 /ORGANISM="Chlorarachnion reptans, Strain CCCM449" /LENGTH=557 /DNA_ID=CAMNT_0001692915 /DNA_START=107 /DNA_END=1780 /DNA_ORIENTATION=+
MSSKPPPRILPHAPSPRLSASFCPANLVMAAVFLDLLGVALVIPNMPYYLKDLGLTKNGTMLALITTIYPLAQTVGGVVIGYASDRGLARRDMLLLSFVGAGISYAMVGLAILNGNQLLFGASRLVVGLVKQTMVAGTALILERSGGQDRERTVYIGRLEGIAGVAFTVGPILGGYLSRYGKGVPPFVATAIFMLDIVFVLATIPRSCEKPPPQSPDAGGSKMAEIPSIENGAYMSKEKQGALETKNTKSANEKASLRNTSDGKTASGIGTDSSKSRSANDGDGGDRRSPKGSSDSDGLRNRKKPDSKSSWCDRSRRDEASMDQNESKEHRQSTRVIVQSRMRECLNILREKHLLLLLCYQVLTQAVRSLGTTFYQDRFDVTPYDFGKFNSFIRGASVVSQWFIVPGLTLHLGLRASLIVCLLTISASAVPQAGLDLSFFSYAMFEMLVIASQAVVKTCLKSGAVKNVDRRNLGSTLAMQDVLMSAAGIVGPMYGGFLLDVVGTSGTPHVRATHFFLIFVVAYVAFYPKSSQSEWSEIDKKADESNADGIELSTIRK